MGSKNSHGTIYIQLEQSSSSGGEEVIGIIHISLKTLLSSPTLILSFKGKETTHWEETRTVSTKNSDGESDSETVTDYYDGKYLICDHRHSVFKWNNELTPGDYSIPFTFILPENIPGSFSYTSSSTLAKIQYKFYAQITTSSHKVSGKVLIHIHQDITIFNTNIILDRSAKMRSWCFYNKGTCTISAHSPQDTYNPSQTAVFFVNVNNSRSQLAIQSISCELFCNLRLQSSSKTNKFIKESLIKKNFPMKINPFDEELHEPMEIYIELGQKLNSLQSMYSTKGIIINCSYTCRIEAVMEARLMCCGEYPRIEMPMIIIPNVIQPQPSAPIDPQDWRPEILPQVNFKSGQESEIRYLDN
ncbi:hypothetical protein SteCoe_7492 [Stentor coeruleus]|uniref:Uncharacterized protein n=1 Tax=Stentor coeruleus TaxID=5963 RepID=A0A1R2CMF9_9CILI|nr:hypothetical protein SteCoe_7492 [Stentor coeruleus]